MVIPALAPDDPLDLLSPAAVEDAPAFFDRVRERGPVVWSQRHKAWLIVGHAELDEAFRDRRLSTERMGQLRERLPERRAEAMAAAIDLLDGWMLFHEPPTHTRLRSPLSRSFTPRSVNSLEGPVQALVDGLIDQLPKGEVFDLSETFTHPLPAAVIAELFGVPPGERDWLAGWSAKFGAVVFGATNRDDYEQVAKEAGEELGIRLGPLFDRYRAEPEDNLLSLLLATEGHEDGLTTTELLGACSLLLFAGHDTTSSFLGSAMLSLLADPDAAEQLRSGSVALEPAIEELLRLDAPAKAMMRTVAESHERAGQQLDAGQAVFMAIIGANRDPDVFTDPTSLDLTRDPNPHLTFGLGHHFCLGVALARLESRLAIPALLRRLPDLQLAGPVEWKASISDRSAARIPVRFG